MGSLGGSVTPNGGGDANTSVTANVAGSVQTERESLRRLDREQRRKEERGQLLKARLSTR
jgi:hypothetical protein